MIISALHEPGNETRVAITPTVIKNYVKLGFEVTCEHNAGKLAGFADQAYEQAGAAIITDRKA